MNGDLYQPMDAARLLGVGVPTLRRWARTGRIGYVRLPSGHHRYLAADVHALLERRIRDTTRAALREQVVSQYGSGGRA